MTWINGWKTSLHEFNSALCTSTSFLSACDPVEIADQQHAAYAGWLNLSKNPAAIEGTIASFDISWRRWDEQIEPLIWALGTLLLVPGLSTNAGRYPHGGTLPLGVLSLVLFFWDGRRIWGWLGSKCFQIGSECGADSVGAQSRGANSHCRIGGKRKPRTCRREADVPLGVLGNI